MRAWSRLRGHTTAGRTGGRPPRRLRRLRASAVAVVTAGALLALAAPAAAHVENPGSFTFNESGAVLRVGLFQIPLPAGSMAGQIDADGNITIPDSTLAITDQPFSQNLNAVFGAVSVSGTVTVEQRAGRNPRSRQRRREPGHFALRECHVHRHGHAFRWNTCCLFRDLLHRGQRAR